jgi:hypothetical protein
MAMVGDRNSLAAIHRIKGIKEETVCRWLKLAQSHIEQIEEHMMENYQRSRVQLDALWTYVGHKGEKGGEQKKKEEEPFGVELPEKRRPVYGLDALSANLKKKSRQHS